MKALFISNDPSLFDAASPARARLKAYAEAIGELHVISRAPQGAVVSKDGALSLHPLRGGPPATLLRLPGMARELIGFHGIEVVSAQDPFEHGWAAARATRGTSAKLHIQVHTDFLSPWFVRAGVFRSPQAAVPMKNFVRRMLADMVLPNADAIRAVGKRVRDSLVARYGDRIPYPSVLPIAPPDASAEPVPLPPHGFQFALITAGRLEPEKRVEDILYALARIGYRHQNVGLFVVGEGSERARLARITERLGLSSRVVFLGWREDLPGLMKSAHAYIQASAYEGYGRTLVEAALARIPIITTDVGIVGEVFRGYEEVLAAPPGDPAALATHILGLVEDHQARAIFVQAAEAAARAHVAQFSDLPAMIRDDLARAGIPSAA